MSRRDVALPRLYVTPAGATSPAYIRLSQRSTLVGTLLTIDVVVIVFLMVVKPTL